MALTLVVNPGSSSKKYALYEGERLLGTTFLERFQNHCEVTTTIEGIIKEQTNISPDEYQEGLLRHLTALVSGGVLTDPGAIKRVGVRVVAPGTFFQAHRAIDDVYLRRLVTQEAAAPLHIPPLESELKILKKFLPAARLYGISDSAFHSTQIKAARHYSLPPTDAAAFDIYRFGYHGLAAASVVSELSHTLGRVPPRAVVCHLGSGVSVTTLKAGISLHNTMGYAPGTGLTMASRAGDLDTGALFALLRQRPLKPLDAEMYLSTMGGLKALGGETDLRHLLERRAQGDPIAHAALEHFVFHIKRAVGAAWAILGGLDALLFTATAGERSPSLRALIAGEWEGLGLILDDDMNHSCVSRSGIISRADSPVTIAVIKADEALVIVRATAALDEA